MPQNLFGFVKSLYAAVKVIEPFLEYLRQDIEAVVLARSATLGFFLGLCPIIGVSALICLAICFLFSNLIFAPMALLLNFVAVPVEVGLIIPFMRFGEFVLRADHVNVVPKHFKDMFKAGEALKGLGHAVFGWLLISIVLLWPVSTLLTPCFAKLKERFSSRRRVDSDDFLLGTSDQEDVEFGSSNGSLSMRNDRRPTLSPRSSRENIRDQESQNSI